MSDAVEETAKWAREALAKKEVEKTRVRLGEVSFVTAREWHRLDIDLIEKWLNPPLIMREDGSLSTQDEAREELGLNARIEALRNR